MQCPCSLTVKIILFSLSLKVLDTLPSLACRAHLALLALRDHQASQELASCPTLTSPTVMNSGVS